MSSDYLKPGRRRKGWVIGKDGKWEPEDTKDKPRDLPAVNAKKLDDSLEASHRRMTRSLALETARLEAAATLTALTGADIDILGRLSQTWRTLVQNEPTPDFSDLTDDEVKAKLEAVKRR